MVEFAGTITFGTAGENIRFVLALRYDYLTRNRK